MNENNNEATEAQLFATAVIHWLSEFAQSPMGSESRWSVLMDADVLYKVFRYFIVGAHVSAHTDTDASMNIDVHKHSDTHYSKCQEQNHNTEALIHNLKGTACDKMQHIPTRTLVQIDALNSLLHAHLKAKVQMNALPNLDLYKLVLFKDCKELVHLCQMLLVLGTYTSKEATCGQSYMEFLTEEDKEVITKHNITRNVRMQSHTELGRTFPFQPHSNFQKMGSEPELVHDSTSNKGSHTITEDEYRALKWENEVFEKVIANMSVRKSNSSR